MANFLPGVSKCSITGRVLGSDDEVAFFPPFSHPDPSIQKCSDGVIDFAAVRTRPEFYSLVAFYRSLIDGKEYVFKNNDGAVVRLRYGQVQLVFLPLLLSLNAPESSVQNLSMSNFSEISLSTGQCKFEDYGLGLDYASEHLTAQLCPTKYLPSGANPKLVQRLNRSGRGELESFLKFIANVSRK